jgi:putative ABC transport system substrate-binding protein
VSPSPGEWTRSQVLQAVARDYPSQDAAAVMSILDLYGSDASEPGRVRVQLAILTLSHGDLEELRKLVAHAKRDYRDVLYWTELAQGVRDPIGDRFFEATLVPALTPARLALLKETVPEVTRVAVFWTRGYPPHRAQLVALEAKAQELHLTLRPITVTRAVDLESAFVTMRREQGDSLIILTSMMLQFHLRELADGALRGQVPAISELPEFPRLRGLMSYGPSLAAMRRRADASAENLVRRLEHEEPMDVEAGRPLEPELVINLGTARALGITVPPSVLRRAAEVIQ